jgi:hypothetical protein
MNVEGDRKRREEYQRLHAMVAMRETVAGALAKYHERAGSAAIIDAVDEALSQIVDNGDHVGDSERSSNSGSCAPSVGSSICTAPRSPSTGGQPRSTTKPWRWL